MTGCDAVEVKPFQPTAIQQQALGLLSGPARSILLYGGSRSGKTFILVYAMIYRALKASGSRHAILRRHFNTVKQAVAFDTFPKVMRTCFPAVKWTLNQTDWFASFRNGSEIWFGGLDNKDRVEKILGREFATIWFNECSEISEDSEQTAMTRLAQQTELTNRAYYDCNPPSKRHWVYKRFFGDTKAPGTATLRMNPMDNQANIAQGYIEQTLAQLPAAKRARFLDGKFADVVEGALWKQEDIDRFRVSVAPQLVRLVVGLDPSCTDTGDEAGIVVAGRAADGHLYVLDDRSRQTTPEGWAREAVNAYRDHKADRIIYETNQGGQMVLTTLHTVDKLVPARGVHASRGKITRAEPIAALAEQGKVHHVGCFPQLEDELCCYTGASGEESPNRFDACVYALTELTLRAPITPRVF